MESNAMMQTISFSPQPWRSPLPCSSSSRKTSCSLLSPLLCRRSPTSPSSSAPPLSPSLHLLLSGRKLPSSSSSLDSPGRENQYAKKHFFLEINAIAKKQKPPLKPASRNAIIASIVVPLLLAGGAAITGRVLLRKLESESLAEAEEWEKRFNPQRLLPDGKRNDEDDTEEPEPADNVAVVGTRNRPKREE